MTLRRSDPARITYWAAFTALATAALSLLAGVGSPSSVLLGGAFMIVNFSLIRMLVSRLIRPGASKGATMALLAAKFFLLLLLVVAVLAQFPVEPMSFGVGATALVIAAVLEGTLLGEVLPPPDPDHDSRDSGGPAG